MHPLTDELPGSEPGTSTGLVFATPSQLELLAGLRRLRLEIGDRYEGCLRAFAATENPDCLAQAALSMREIFDGLHLIVEIPRPRTFNMIIKANELRQAWDSLIRNTRAYDARSGTWPGPMDDHLVQFLRRVAAFIRWLVEEHPYRSVELEMILNKFDPGPGYLQADLLRERRTTLDELDTYMNGVAHHRRATTREEFEQKLAACDQFLSRLIAPLLEPQPFADRETLDTLLEDTTTNAES